MTHSCHQVKSIFTDTEYDNGCSTSLRPLATRCVTLFQTFVFMESLDKMLSPTSTVILGFGTVAKF